VALLSCATHCRGPASARGPAGLSAWPTAYRVVCSAAALQVVPCPDSALNPAPPPVSPPRRLQASHWPTAWHVIRRNAAEPHAGRAQSGGHGGGARTGVHPASPCAGSPARRSPPVFAVVATRGRQPSHSLQPTRVEGGCGGVALAARRGGGQQLPARVYRAPLVHCGHVKRVPCEAGVVVKCTRR
jgi:hypothetical protein